MRKIFKKIFSVIFKKFSQIFWDFSQTLLILHDFSKLIKNSQIRKTGSIGAVKQGYFFRGLKKGF